MCSSGIRACRPSPAWALLSGFTDRVLGFRYANYHVLLGLDDDAGGSITYSDLRLLGPLLELCPSSCFKFGGFWFASSVRL